MVRKNVAKLILAVGQQGARIVKKARELGYRTAWLEDAEAGEKTFDAEAIAEKARAEEADGIVTNDFVLLGAAALYWLTAWPGVVHSIEGVDQAREMAGMVEVAVSAKPGDTLRHIVDQEGQQRVGYVAATGARVPEAVATAKRAQRCCRVATRAIHDDLESWSRSAFPFLTG